MKMLTEEEQMLKDLEKLNFNQLKKEYDYYILEVKKTRAFHPQYKMCDRYLYKFQVDMANRIHELMINFGG